ncbi:MAG: hypothetical protein V4615_00435 [Bacteroidota bacterium]
MKLSKYFENPFEGKDITVTRLIIFAVSHLSKLIAFNVGNIYDTIITDTTNKIQALQNAVDAEDVEEDQSIGATLGKNTARKTLQKFISDKEGIIKGTFGKDSVTYKEFFPNGLEAFHKATDQEFITLVNSFKTKVTNHVADLGVPFQTAVNNAVAAFAAAMGLHVTETGEIDPASVTILTAQHDLAVQLQVNLFTVGINNSGGPADIIASKFFDESLLFAEHHKSIFKAHPAPNSTVPVCAFAYQPGKSFHMKNKGAKPLSFRFSVDGILVGTEYNVAPGEQVDKNFPDFYVTGDTLVCINSEAVAGNYEVDELV